jgi:hypothetical protein
MEDPSIQETADKQSRRTSMEQEQRKLSNTEVSTVLAKPRRHRHRSIGGSRIRLGFCVSLLDVACGTSCIPTYSMVFSNK